MFFCMDQKEASGDGVSFIVILKNICLIPQKEIKVSQIPR